MEINKNPSKEGYFYLDQLAFFLKKYSTSSGNSGVPFLDLLVFGALALYRFSCREKKAFSFIYTEICVIKLINIY